MTLPALFRRLFALALLLPPLLGLGGGKKAPPDATSRTTSGGIAYTFIAMTDQKDVTISIAWPTDWVWRGDVNPAVPSVGADLILAGGAAGYKAGAVGERFADLKASGNLVATPDHVYGHLSMAKAAMDEPLTIANAHLRAPTLDEAWRARIADQWEKNTTEFNARPDAQLFTAARWAILGDTPLQHALSLEKPGLFAAVTGKEIAAWHAEVFTRKPDAIVVAGEISAAEADKAVDTLLAGLPEGTGRVMKREVTTNFARRRILLHRPESPVTQLYLIGPMPPTRKGHDFEQVLLVGTLGGDAKGLLFESVRTRLRASYGIGAGAVNYSRENRVLSMGAEIDVAKAREVEDTILQTYTDFLAGKPPTDPAPFKSAMNAQVTQVVEHCDTLASSALQALLDRHPASMATDFAQLLDAVSPQSLKAALNQDMPRPDALVTVAISSDKDALPGACVISDPSEAVRCR